MDVSIIIVNYNTKQLTSETIESVFEKTDNLKYEVILVDNTSTDGSREFFSKDNRIKYIYNNDNLGFGRANNIGIKIANGRNILFLNPDTLLINNAVKVLSDYLDNNSRTGAVGGNLYTKDGEPNSSLDRQVLNISALINIIFFSIPFKLWYGKNVKFNHTNKPLKVPSIIGADLMVRKDVLEKVGVFDPDFFMYREETELCWRIMKNGYDIYSIPSAKIIHYEGQSNSVKESKVIMALESTKIYLNKTRSTNYGRVYWAIYKLFVYERIGLSYVLKMQDKRKFYLMILSWMNNNI